MLAAAALRLDRPARDEPADALDPDDVVPLPLHRRHGGLDDGGARAAALARLRAPADRRGLEPERALRARSSSRSSASAASTPCSRSCSSSSSRARSRAARPRNPSACAERRRRMFEIWYAITVFMLTAYVVLDGYDFGAGALHLLVARNDAERRQVLAAIGPFWDANEVWLLAAGGALFVAFPRVLSAGISGFYFAIFLVLWCLILRGIAIELRSHVADRLWRGTFDLFFSVASLLLPVFFGAALGQPAARLAPFLGRLVRARALHRLHGEGAGRHPRLVHGFDRRLRARGPRRARRGLPGMEDRRRGRGRAAAASRAGSTPSCAVLWPLADARDGEGQPVLLPGAPDPAARLGARRGRPRGPRDGLRRPRPRAGWPAAFFGSCAFLAGLSTATAACVFPVMLRASGDGALSITADGAGEIRRDSRRR